MNYFPMFMDIKGREVLICGGGAHALEKIERLKPFGANLHVISPQLLLEIEEMDGVRTEKRRFVEKDLDSFPIFLVAAEGRDENERIAGICRTRHIPVNAVDMQDICDFIFPAMVPSSQMCIAISTGGLSPAFAVELKKRIHKCLPDDIDDILLWMNEIREKIRSQIPDKEKQKYILRRIAEETFEKGRRLTEEEWKEWMEIN